MKKSAWHPARWTPSVYFWTFGLLAAVNLFGPKGFLHWLLLRKERQRLEARAVDTRTRIDSIVTQIEQFSSSRVARQRAIRAELGYLKANEYSVEILDEQDDPKDPLLR